MSEGKRITCPGDLPPRYQKVWATCVQVYIRSRLFESKKAAEAAAFEDVRRAYWSEAKRACEGDNEPGFAWWGDDDVTFYDDES